MMPDRYVRVALVYEDADILELDVTATNGRFTGAGLYYVGVDSLEETHELLAGFPVRADDSREVIFGSLEPGFARGGVRLHFSCVGLARRAHISVEMLTHNETGTLTDAELPDQRVTFWAAVEPAAVDSFLVELKAMVRRERLAATLSLLTS